MKIEELSEKSVYRSSNIYYRNITCTIRLSPISFTAIFFKTE